MSDIDNDITRRFREGDRAAFEEVYIRTSKLIYNVIYRLILDEEDAKDIAHDVYIKAYEKRDSFRGDASISTWLYRIAVNQALNFGKRKSWFRTRADMVRNEYYGKKDDHSPPTNDTEKKVRKVKELIERLKPEYKACVVLRDLEHIPYKQIADTLNLNIGTVRSRINRGRTEIARMYKKMEMS